MKKLKTILCILSSGLILLMLSCGHSLTEQELKDLESRAEKGDLEAALALLNYYNEIKLYSSIEYGEIEEKAKQGDKDAQEKIANYKKRLKVLRMAADLGDPESALYEANFCLFDFYDSINVKENKKNYRKYMEIVVASVDENTPYIIKGKKDNIDIRSEIDRYNIYKNQSKEWWNSDSIDTKEELSRK